MEKYVEYEPIPVKELLKEMKNISSLMVDLAYLSVLHRDVELAEEVFELEKKMDKLEILLTMQASLATRSPRDAEKIVSIHRLATASNKISDAAADIASIVLQRGALPPLSAEMLFERDSFVAKISVPEDFEGEREIGQILNELGAVLNFIAVRRDSEYVLEPTKDFRIRKGDVLIVEGTERGLEKLRKWLGLPPLEKGTRAERGHDRIAEGLFQLRSTSQVMLDLAYTALLIRSEDVAERVSELEDYVDKIARDLELKAIAAEGLSPEEKLGIVSIAVSSENMADAAAEMVEPLLSGLEPHPIITDVLWEAEERISVIEMDEADEGKTLDELGYGERGIRILAIKRGDEWYTTPPYSSLRVKKGDILIVKYFSESEEFVEELESEEDREEMIEEIQEEEWEEE